MADRLSRVPLAVRLACACFRALNRRLPVGFRRRFGDESARLFAELAAREYARGGNAALLLLAVRSYLDLLCHLPWLRSRSSKNLPTPGQTMDALFADLRYAARSLIRHPGHSAMVIATLAAAIAANAAVFSVVDAVLFRQLPYRDADRLVMIFNKFPTLEYDRSAQNPRDWFDYQDMTDAFEQIEVIGGSGQLTMTGLGDATRVLSIAVSTEFMPMLGVELALGRHFASDDESGEMLISHGFWQQQLGGDPDVVGRTLVLNDATREIIGVLPADFDLHLPEGLGLSTEIAVWGRVHKFLGPPGQRDISAHWLYSVAKLAAGRTLEQAQDQLDAVAAYQHDDQPLRAERQASIEVVPLHREVVGEVRPTLTALFGAVGFLLLIACANLANLMIVRGQARQGELAARSACGGSRIRIVRHLLAESAVLGVVGTTAGVGLGWLALRLIVAASPDELPLTEQVALDARVLLFTAGATLASVVLFGLLPALAATRGNLAAPLAGRERIAGGERRFGSRSALVVAEIALTLILMTGGGLLVRSLSELAAQSPGLATDRVLTFVVPPGRDVWAGEQQRANRWDVNPAAQVFFRELQEAFAAVPGVESVSNVWPVPLSGEFTGAPYASEATEDKMQDNMAGVLLTLPGYFDTVDVPIVSGRDFTWQDSGDEVIVDERLAEDLWPGQDPVGQRIKIGWWSGDAWADVIGVAAPTRTRQLGVDDPPTIYRHGNAYAYVPQPFIVRTQADPLTVVDGIRQALGRTYPGLPLDTVQSMDGYVSEQLLSLEFVTDLIVAFALAGLLIASVGLYGVVSYVVAQRTREIGIRMALGATSRGIFGLVLRHGMTMVVVGVVVGVVGASWLTGILGSLLYGIEATDGATFATVAALMAAIAMLACWMPAVRAARRDPMRSLRAD